MKTMDQEIGQVPAFAGLAPPHLELIAGCATNVRAAAGDYLFREGDQADAFYAIRQGAVALELHVPARDAVIIDTMHEGDLVGWSWLFPPHRWEFDGRVRADTALIKFDGACLRGKCDADHELGYELMRRFAQVIIERLQATRLRLLDVYGVGTPA
jgi:CRP/FNR family transcriptional regulator, cyclic AMP receptor protein